MQKLLYLCIPFVLMACASTSTIHTKPLGAEVFINGQRCGVSPCIHHDRHGFPDRMRVQIRSPGYQSAEFFVYTEPPAASFLLWGFGSYVLHTFSKEYRFTLAPLDTSALKSPSKRFLSKDGTLDNAQIANILEQCLYWVQKEDEDIWSNRFMKNAASLDCEMAEAVITTSSTKTDNPSPALARALIRYMDYRRSMNQSPVALRWSIKTLCKSAVIEYAKRTGTDETPPPFPAFNVLCPEESKLLSNK